MKKYISFLSRAVLVLALVLTLLPQPAYAASASLSSSDSSLRAGDTFTLTYKVSGSGILGLEGSLSYDSASLSLVSSKNLLGSSWTMSMNGNNFTCGAFKLKNGNVAAFAETMKEAVMNNQWMCGQPETLVIVSFGGGYVMMAYGINDAMDPFVEHMNSVYADAEVLVTESLI